MTVYLIIINIISALVTFCDKQAAKVHATRVPERILWLLSAIFGSFAMYTTMLVIRHKTKHISFMVGIPVIMIVQVIILCMIYK